MQQLSLPAGSMIYLGRPAKPMPPERAAAIGTLVDSIRGIAEAHLPQCFVLEVMPAPAQILVLGLEPGADKDVILAQVGTGLERILPPGVSLDVLPLALNSDTLGDVRAARCAIGQAAVPRWMFWKRRGTASS